IDVEMASNDKDTKYNLYELDTVKRNWAYKGKDKVKVGRGDKDKVRKGGSVSDTASELLGAIEKSNPKLEKLNKEVALAKEEVAKTEKQKPLEPKKANAEKYR